ncbi:hypothetical protein EJ05DRAFT_498111 [Pseudovirgaria hyperparasitica]|uniref:Cell wall protein n=1 Tax=Pseudovirgaria hyperparasitica TaxID=470096 RepID=A0A6A6WG76_9PEZI|nr:uncharacterized protein EJ05DRAFT_498111 [Pseudovirgaria hyperparasitica]KAF2760141.1 hypothetical protein EJ05DRAFT_498111 [Pseudovirgaria hyperparasitica]
MKNSLILSLPFLISISSATPIQRSHIHRREVPQEHSHEAILRTVNTLLKTNNPDNIQDAVFGLLGNAAASTGQGNIADTDCLQQATADQAFTNAKAASDTPGMTAALLYRALERNTGKVGLASTPCTALTATNPEIAALTQHQDPASADAAQGNKALTLELARQIASVGGDPLDALKAGTFAPGDVNDPTARGNSCDDADDAQGCIESLGLRVDDATEAEIRDAVAGAGGAGAEADAGAGTMTMTVMSDVPVASTAVDPAAAVVGCGAPGATAAVVATPTPTPTPTAVADPAPADATALDLGLCADPTIVFGGPFDGRKEDAFQPADTATFTHGSALGIKVITDFICQQLEVKCKASADAIAACNQGAADAQGAQGQGAADAFNRALGF